MSEPAESAHLLARLVEAAEEQLRWQRAAVLPQVRETILQALRTTQARRAYELCDGSRSATEVASALGTNKQNVSRWTRRWRDLGIAYETGGRRIRHLVSLDALGIRVEVDGEPAASRNGGEV